MQEITLSWANSCEEWRAKLYNNSKCIAVSFGPTQADAVQMLADKMTGRNCKHEFVNLIGGPACRKCGWTP